MSNFWPKNWSRSVKKFEQWSLTRELLKQYLAGKQNGHLQSGRLLEVVTCKKRSLWESWLFSLKVSLVGGRRGGVGEELHSMLDMIRRVCSYYCGVPFMDITDDLWHLSEQVGSLWASIPVQLGFCRWRLGRWGMTRAAPPWERKNASQLKQAREMSQTSLSLHTFRPNLNEKKNTFFFWLSWSIFHY